MKFKEFGDPELKTVIPLHGGGLSYWSLEQHINYLSTSYYVVTPIIDGHGEDSDTTFMSIEDVADKLINYIDQNCNGRVHAMCGLSLGAQIIIEVLSRRKGVAEYAVIESGLVIPMKTMTSFSMFMQKRLYSLINQKWFAKMQARTLNLPDHLFDKYYEDSRKISKQSLLNITFSNGNFTLKEQLRKTETKTLIIVGAKEINVIKKSAQILKNTIPKSTLYIAEGMDHGELSLVHHERYLELIALFIEH